jgi:methyl-accepting chemotaxis protein
LADTCDPVFEHLQQVTGDLDRVSAALVESSDTLLRANRAAIAANQHFEQRRDAARAAHGEHDDLRESVAHLERIVMAQVEEVRQLRARLDGNDLTPPEGR